MFRINWNIVLVVFEYLEDRESFIMECAKSKFYWISVIVTSATGFGSV